ncbi:uncharacterized protein LOC135464397 [Liolophura sinensis]|uniref:uncharacterized protein LOC135464397 n=1 Tax=Liolophura sinensis TaxID=3198878 RepID=UPI0031580E54
MNCKRKKQTVAEDISDAKTRKEDTRLYCLCKQLDDPDRTMIQCDFCDEWFHPACVDLEEGEVNDVGRWYCPPCTDVMAQNPSLSRKGFLGFQGRVAPKEGWGEEFLLEDIDESVIQVETKRHRVEGWNLFREGRVTRLSSNKNGNYVYFRSQCQASMRQLSYNVFICFKGSRRLKWSTCSCPAGIDGQCKHLVATLYCLIDLYRLGINKIPDAKTCTQKLQMWHVRKPVTDEPLLFSDINFVKHDPERPVKGDLGCSVKQHNPVPEFASTVTQKWWNNKRSPPSFNIFANVKSPINHEAITIFHPLRRRTSVMKSSSIGESDLDGPRFFNKSYGVPDDVFSVPT